MRARAFCPGHITGFFEICRADDILATGSRGAGMCTTLGASSEVTLEESDRQTVDIEIDGVTREAEVTRRAVRRLVEDRPLEARIRTSLELPESQGFGMSAAGALSACVAAAHLLDIDKQRAFESVHMAEVECGTGLGDVPALHTAGVTVRELPGLPPIGKVHRIDEDPELVIAVVGEPIRTSDTLEDASFAARIGHSGSTKVTELLSRPTVHDLVRLASSFAVETGLAKGRVREAMDAASAAGMASMAMLGNSVFATGRTDDLVSVLQSFGDVRKCGVDTKGVRIVG